MKTLTLQEFVKFKASVTWSFLITTSHSISKWLQEHKGLMKLTEMHISAHIYSWASVCMGISDEIEFASIAIQLMKRRSHCYSILHSCNVGKQMWPNLLKSALHFHSLVLLVKPIAFLICSSLLATQNRLKTRRRIDGKRPAKSTSASAGTNSKEDHSKPKILGSREPSPRLSSLHPKENNSQRRNLRAMAGIFEFHQICF